MNSDQQTEQKAYEKRLRRRLKVLRKTFEEGNISIPDDPHFKESLLAVKYGRGTGHGQTMEGRRSLAWTWSRPQSAVTTQKAAFL